VKATSHLPIVIDPSHGTGILGMIEPMCLAAVAAGADGLEIEVHIDPPSAMSDKDQQLTPGAFAGLMRKIARMRILVQELAAETESESCSAKPSAQASATMPDSAMDADGGKIGIFEDGVD
jgi:hypothetical protein